MRIESLKVQESLEHPDKKERGRAWSKTSPRRLATFSLPELRDLIPRGNQPKGLPAPIQQLKQGSGKMVLPMYVAQGSASFWLTLQKLMQELVDRASAIYDDHWMVAPLFTRHLIAR